MKNNIAFLLALLLAFVCVGCSPTDPLLDDLYTLSIYPSANETYNLGDADYSWDAGWFKNAYVGGYPVVRGATYIVAANDSSASSKAQADYVCDGTADDVQIQAAIDALPAGGGKVGLLEGTFNLAAGITETSDNVHISGQGIEGTTIAPADGITAFTFNDTFYCSLRDLSVAALSQQTSGGGVKWEGDSYCLLAGNLRLENMYNGFVINLDSGGGLPRASTGWIENCVIWETKNHVFDLQMFCGLFINKCTAWNTSDSVRGIAWTGGNTLHITDVELMKCGYGFAVYPASGITTKFLAVNNLQLDTCANDGMNVTNDGTMDPWQITGLLSSNNGGYGVIINAAPNASHIYFENPIIRGNDHTGMYFDDVENVLVQGGVVFGNNEDDNAGVGQQQGIFIKDCNNVRIVGVRALNITGGNQKYGVYHNSGGSDVVVQGCDLGDNDTAGFYSGDWTKVQVRDNAGFITENSGTSSIDSGQTTKVVAHGLAATPTVISIMFAEQGDNDYGRWWVDTIGATTFTLHVTANPGASNLDFYWEAKVR